MYSDTYVHTDRQTYIHTDIHACMHVHIYIYVFCVGCKLERSDSFSDLEHRSRRPNAQALNASLSLKLKFWGGRVDR